MNSEQCLWQIVGAQWMYIGWIAKSMGKWVIRHGKILTFNKRKNMASFCFCTLLYPHSQEKNTGYE